MKLMGKIITVICTLFLLVSGMCVFADTSDPVVSLSYLQEIFMPAMKNEIKEDTSFQVAVIPKGKTFQGDEGCEFIVRSGEAVSVIAENGGLCDITAGRDIGANEEIVKNHMIIIPRSDGRGFVAKTDVIIMVKGSYGVN